ncbi:thiamine phosphate synthase [Clostridium sp. JN-9]|uniref:thiamine phosphate synthase n=1 Tax=Clostridium sp. JN-9 TaxID=2507159 RepID=UPI000FFE0FF9|nr:thiamine phosphate synthase [Clostridium sp. JN-9]QAT40714.1 thiamine phosphate synthase [Clostridium sp. JN-9]
MKNKVNYKLYLVTDRDLLKNIDICTAVEQAIQGGVTLVQLREKELSSLEFYNTALKVKKVTDKYNIPLIINDRLDIALAVDAAGVHVGQSDIPAAIARKLIGPDKILGVSTATVEESIEAEKNGADYIGAGAVFPTSTKLDARAVTVEMLKSIKKNIKIPVVAIGGISENNVQSLRDADIDGVAVISAILGKQNIKEASESLLKLI